MTDDTPEIKQLKYELKEAEQVLASADDEEAEMYAQERVNSLQNAITVASGGVATSTKSRKK